MQFGNTGAMPAPTWIDQSTDVDAADGENEDSPYIRHLAKIGALDEAEAVWEAEAAGTNPCESVSVAEFLAEAKRRSQS